MMRRQGFTLIEVMIAMTVFVVIAIAISETASLRINNLIHLSDKTLASFVAENRVTEIQLNTLPEVGSNKSTTDMAGREWLIKTKVEETPFPGIRRVTVAVGDVNDPENNLVSLISLMGER